MSTPTFNVTFDHCASKHRKKANAVEHITSIKSKQHALDLKKAGACKNSDGRLLVYRNTADSAEAMRILEQTRMGIRAKTTPRILDEPRKHREAKKDGSLWGWIKKHPILAALIATTIVGLIVLAVILIKRGGKGPDGYRDNENGSVDFFKGDTLTTTVQGTEAEVFKKIRSAGEAGVGMFDIARGVPGATQEQLNAAIKTLRKAKVIAKGKGGTWAMRQGLVEKTSSVQPRPAVDPTQPGTYSAGIDATGQINEIRVMSATDGQVIRYTGWQLAAVRAAMGTQPVDFGAIATAAWPPAQQAGYTSAQQLQFAQTDLPGILAPYLSGYQVQGTRQVSYYHFNLPEFTPPPPVAPQPEPPAAARPATFDWNAQAPAQPAQTPQSVPAGAPVGAPPAQPTPAPFGPPPRGGQVTPQSVPAGAPVGAPPAQPTPAPFGPPPRGGQVTSQSVPAGVPPVGAPPAQPTPAPSGPPPRSGQAMQSTQTPPGGFPDIASLMAGAAGAAGVPAPSMEPPAGITPPPPAPVPLSIPDVDNALTHGITEGAWQELLDNIVAHSELPDPEMTGVQDGRLPLSALMSMNPAITDDDGTPVRAVTIADVQSVMSNRAFAGGYGLSPEDAQQVARLWAIKETGSSIFKANGLIDLNAASDFFVLLATKNSNVRPQLNASEIPFTELVGRAANWAQHGLAGMVAAPMLTHLGAHLRSTFEAAQHAEGMAICEDFFGRALLNYAGNTAQVVDALIKTDLLPMGEDAYGGAWYKVADGVRKIALADLQSRVGDVTAALETLAEAEERFTGIDLSNVEGSIDTNLVQGQINAIVAYVNSLSEQLMNDSSGSGAASSPIGGGGVVSGFTSDEAHDTINEGRLAITDPNHQDGKTLAGGLGLDPNALNIMSGVSPTTVGASRVFNDSAIQRPLFGASRSGTTSAFQQHASLQRVRLPARA